MQFKFNPEDVGAHASRHSTKIHSLTHSLTLTHMSTQSLRTVQSVLYGERLYRSSFSFVLARTTARNTSRASWIGGKNTWSSLSFEDVGDDNNVDDGYCSIFSAEQARRRTELGTVMLLSTKRSTAQSCQSSCTRCSGLIKFPWANVDAPINSWRTLSSSTGILAGLIMDIIAVFTESVQEHARCIAHRWIYDKYIVGSKTTKTMRVQCEIK